MTEALAQTVLQMGMTNYQPLRSYAVTHFIPNRTWLGTSYALSVRTLYRVLYVGRYAVYVQCGAVLGQCGPIW